MPLSEDDIRLRGVLALAIAEDGYAPANAALADRAGLSLTDVEASLRRLHDGHALQLHPHVCRPWVVHPFALAPGSCWVQTPALGYWANCLYCAFGIAAALETDAVISTRIGGEGEAVTYVIEGGRPPESSDVFHLSTPVAHWWDTPVGDRALTRGRGRPFGRAAATRRRWARRRRGTGAAVIFTCSSFQPFHAEADVDAWCARHDLPKGAVLTMPALWAFASDWYGRHFDQPWRKRSLDEVRALFAGHRLTGDFWRV